MSELSNIRCHDIYRIAGYTELVIAPLPPQWFLMAWAMKLALFGNTIIKWSSGEGHKTS